MFGKPGEKAVRSCCNCELCYCANYHWTKKAQVCEECKQGQHGTALKQPNRFRTCRLCGMENRGLDVSVLEQRGTGTAGDPLRLEPRTNTMPVECAGCGTPFGRLEIGFDRIYPEVFRGDTFGSMTSAADFMAAIKRGRKKK